MLEHLADFGLQIWGSDYWRTRTRKGSPLRRCWTGRPAHAEEFPRICADAKILLNIMDPLTWPGPNMRAFEQAACKGFTLMTRSPAVLALFAEGKDIECFDGVSEAKEKIVRYLREEDERRRIAEAAFQLVAARGQTYVDRARQLVSCFEEDNPSKA